MRLHHLTAAILRLTRRDFTALVGVVILRLGCGDSTGPIINGLPPGPTTGAIQVVVETAGPDGYVDPDGYSVSIDAGLGHALAIQGTLTIADLAAGSHLVRLGGVASNCLVGGTNPRSVDVVASLNAADPRLVYFFVTCVANPGTIQVTTVTSGPEP